MINSAKFRNHLLLHDSSDPCVWNKYWFKIWKLESFRCSKRSWQHPRFSEDNRLPSVKQSRFHIKVNPWSTFQIILRLSNIVFIVCPGNWQTEVASKSCSAESSRPMDKMVQLFEIRSLLENNASYAQGSTVILSGCHLGHSAISLKFT